MDRWTDGCHTVPVELLRRLWVDPAWRTVLRATFVGQWEDSAGGAIAVAGLLDEIGESGVAVVGFDGGRRNVTVTELVFPHSEDIGDLAAARALLGGAGRSPVADQLVRRGLRWRPGKYDARRAGDHGRDRALRVGLAPLPVVVADTESPDYPREQVVRVHVYRHAELGDRPVARLLTEAEAVGADLYAAQLGCPPAQVSPPVAAAIRHPLLGFPAWAQQYDVIAEAEAIEGVCALAEARRLAYDDDPDAAVGVLQRAAARLPVRHRASFWVSACSSTFDTGGGSHWTDQHTGVKTCRTEIRSACRRSNLSADPDLMYALTFHHDADPQEACDALALRDGPAAALTAYRAVALTIGSSSGVFAKLREYATAAGLDRLTEDVADLRTHLEQHGYLFGVSDAILKNRKKAITQLVLTDDRALRLIFSMPYELYVLDRCGVLDSLLKNKQVLARLRGGTLWPGSSATAWVDEHFGAMLADSAPRTAGYDQARRLTDLLVPESAMHG